MTVPRLFHWFYLSLPWLASSALLYFGRLRDGDRAGKVLRRLVGLAMLAAAVRATAVPFAFVGVLLFFSPWWIARFVLIPLGLARLAYWCARLADLTFALDRHGGAAAAAAWALCRQRLRNDETVAWLEARIDAEAPLKGAGVLASGLVLAARGDLDGARTLIEAVLKVDPRACPPVARRLAVSWLAADAARRGAWRRVAELGATLGDGGPTAWLLSAIAQSLLLEPMAPGELGLWLRWALAPNRARTLPLVRRAIEASRGTFIEPAESLPRAAPEHTGDDPLRTALALHASVLVTRPASLRASDVCAAGHAWDAALVDPATERTLLERSLVLGAGSSSEVLERTRAAVEDDLADVVLAAGIALRELETNGDVVGRVRSRLRDRLLSEVEAASDAIARRAAHQKALPATSEWREWWNLVATYERAVASAGPELRRIAFVKVYPDATSFAVWLYNHRKERPLANAVFRWLLGEATALDDARAVTLMTNNVECGI